MTGSTTGISKRNKNHIFQPLVLLSFHVSRSQEIMADKQPSLLP